MLIGKEGPAAAKPSFLLVGRYNIHVPEDVLPILRRRFDQQVIPVQPYRSQPIELPHQEAAHPGAVPLLRVLVAVDGDGQLHVVAGPALLVDLFPQQRLRLLQAVRQHEAVAGRHCVHRTQGGAATQEEEHHDEDEGDDTTHNGPSGHGMISKASRVTSPLPAA